MVEMYSKSKILTFGLLACLGNFTPTSLYAKNKNSKSTKKENITLGFRTGRDYQIKSNTVQPLGTNVQEIFARKNFNPHLKLEIGLDYHHNINKIYYPSIKSNSFRNTNTFTLSAPVSISYYFLPQKSRLHPFCGVGLETTLYNTAPDFKSPTGDINLANTSAPGTKYINLFFTQGITYEVNTKIEFSQSFHFNTESNLQTIGITVGVGFRLD